MSEFPQFNNAKLMIAASVRHCRITIEHLPVGQIVVDEFGIVRSIDVITEETLGFKNLRGKMVSELLVDGRSVFPRRLSIANLGDLGDMTFRSYGGTDFPARIVCVPGSTPGTFLLSVAFR